jgi:hypothetical protein
MPFIIVCGGDDLCIPDLSGSGVKEGWQMVGGKPLRGRSIYSDR